MSVNTNEVAKLYRIVREHTNNGLPMVEVMMVVLDREIQPLKDRAHPMYKYTGEDDSAPSLRSGFYEGRSPREMIFLMFKGKTTTCRRKLSSLDSLLMIHEMM